MQETYREGKRQYVDEELELERAREGVEKRFWE